MMTVAVRRSQFGGNLENIVAKPLRKLAQASW